MAKDVKIVGDADTVEEQLEDNRNPDFVGEAFAIKWTGDDVTDLRWMTQQGNLAKFMTDSARAFYGTRIIEQVAIDEGSRSAWVDGAEHGLRLSELNEYDAGDLGVADEDEDNDDEIMPRFPMVSQAVIEFASQAGEALLSDPRPVKVSPPPKMGSVNDQGEVAKADQLADALSWQITVVDRKWTSDTDKMLHSLACIGTMFRKTTVDPTTGRNQSKLCSGLDVIVNNSVSSLYDAPRISERFTDYPHVVRRKIQTGEYYDVDIQNAACSGDWHSPIEFLECHTWLDLDDDGADEPYIVVVQVTTKRIVALHAGWTESGFTVTDTGIWFEQIRQYTDYHLVPSFDGSFYSKGFGHLVGRLSSTVDDLIASIVRTAKLNNENGGVIGRIGSGMPENIPLKYDELTVIPTDGQALQQQLVMFPTKQVPPTLFQVLGVLTEAGQRLTSTVNLADQPANMPAATAMAITDQGARIYSAILKRVWTSMSDEFTLLYDLNRSMLKGTLSFEYQGRSGQVAPNDFQQVRDVCVSADPRVSSAAHRASLSGYYAQFIGDPNTNQVELRKRMHMLMRVPAPDALIKEEPQGIPPDVEMEIAEAKSKIFEREIKAKLVAAQAANELLGALGQITQMAPQLAGTPEVAAQFATAYQIMQQIAKLGAKVDDEQAGGMAPPPAGGPTLELKPNQLPGMAGGPGNAGASGPVPIPPPPTSRPMGGR